jgi:hypothetical protein
VNRHRDDPVAATLRLADVGALSGTAYLVDGPHPATVNSFEQPDAVGVTERPLQLTEGQLRWTFPAHSVTLLTMSS